MKRSLILVLFSTAFIIACGANKSVIKNNVSGGDAEAKFISEECCVKSEEVYKNFAEAANRIEKLFEQNNADAQYKLGIRYYTGDGVEKNHSESVKWFRKAAEQGHAEAQSVLGGYYYNGEGVEKNLAEAIEWYKKAAEQGNAEAQYNLGVCYEKGEGVDKNLAEAAKWYRKVAEQGDANAQRNLGLYYIQEKRDNVIGYAWIFLSVKNGLEDTTSKLAELEKQMDKGEIERAKKLAEEYSKGNFDK